MPDHKLTAAEERMLWEEAARRLSMVDPEPTFTMQQLDHLLEQLPAPQPGESLEDRIGRVSHQQTGMIEPFAVIQLDALGDGCVLLQDTMDLRKCLRRFSVGRISESTGDRFAPVTEVFRMAAADSDANAELPDRALESDDGRFRIRVIPKKGGIEVSVQALGYAADEFAHARIGFCSPSVDKADSPDQD